MESFANNNFIKDLMGEGWRTVIGGREKWRLDLGERGNGGRD